MDEKRFTCLNGHFVLATRAAVAVADRGFRYGDSVFESIRTHVGIPLAWDRHMERLAGGLAALGIDFDLAPLHGYAKKLLVKNHAGDGFLRIQISRGVGSRGYAPHPPGMPATSVLEWLPGLPEGELPPCRLWLSARPAIPPECLPTQHKLGNGLSHVLAIMEAQQHGCDDALQLGIDGTVCSASAGNIFWLKDGTLFTPSVDSGCLAGITRALVLESSPVPVRIVQQGLGSLLNAEAMFITNSRVGIWPVAELLPTGKIFGPNPVYRQVTLALAATRKRLQAADKKRWGNPA